METHKYIFLIILLTASVFDLVIPVLLGSKYPKYNHFYDTISKLGSKNSPVRKWENLNLIFVGVLFIIFVFGQQQFINCTQRSSILYLTGILTFGIGCIIAGFFPVDLKGTKETVNGKIHSIASGIGFMLLLLCPLWALFIDDFKGQIILNLILFVLSLASFVLFIASENNNNGILKYTGLYQRLNLLFMYSCLITNYVSTLN